jgi:hypothetical protein
MLLNPSIGVNMPLYVNIGKETFLLQEFMQAGFVPKLANQRTISFDQQL